MLVRDTALQRVPAQWVTLHRVGSDTAGPLDSARTGADGGYRFQYRPSGSTDALYFVSSSYGGIAYFTPPLRAADVRGEAAEITVFDTTSAAVPISVRGRHLIVSAPSAQGTRRIVEVFELTNDTSVTAVPAARASGTWSVALPAGARAFSVRAGEVPADGMTVSGGRAVLRVPVAPGLKQVAFTYELPGDAFPLQLALEQPVTVLEVLLEDPRGTATGAKLVATSAVVLEGSTFQRYLAQDPKAGERLVVALPVPPLRWEGYVPAALLVGIGGAMFVLLLRSGSRRRAARAPVAAMPARTATAPSAAPAPAAARVGADRDVGTRDAAPRDSAWSDDPERERLLAALAALDDAVAATPPTDAAARARYADERETLKRALAARLAAVPGAG